MKSGHFFWFMLHNCITMHDANNIK